MRVKACLDQGSDCISFRGELRVVLLPVPGIRIRVVKLNGLFVPEDLQELCIEDNLGPVQPRDLVPANMNFLGYRRVCPINVGTLTHHRLVYPIRLPEHISCHSPQLRELHFPQAEGIRRPASPLLQDTNPMPTTDTLMLLPPAIGKLCKLVVTQPLSKRDNTTGLSRVKEEVPGPFRTIPGRVNINQDCLDCTQAPVVVNRVRIPQLDNLVRAKGYRLPVGPSIQPARKELVLVRYWFHPVGPYRPHLDWDTRPARATIQDPVPFASQFHMLPADLAELLARHKVVRTFPQSQCLVLEHLSPGITSPVRRGVPNSLVPALTVQIPFAIRLRAGRKQLDNPVHRALHARGIQLGETILCLCTVQASLAIPPTGKRNPVQYQLTPSLSNERLSHQEASGSPASARSLQLTFSGRSAHP